MMSTLEKMIAQDMDETASPISNRMLDEINAEIVFIQEQFNTLDSYPSDIFKKRIKR